MQLRAHQQQIQPLCLTYMSTPKLSFLGILLTSVKRILMSPSMRSSMLGYTPTEALSSDRAPRTPLRQTETRDLRADTETVSMQESYRQGRVSGLHVDTSISEPLQPGSRRVSPSGSTDDSPASSTSNHSRQDSTASYTPLRSARGSLSLGVG